MDKDSTPAKVESYLISIRGGNKERMIRLSSGMFRFAVASLIIGALLLIGTAAYSFYGTLRMQRDAATIREIEQAAELRQEQLLTLSKKAATLSETIQNLAQQEQELRIQAGLNPPVDETPPASPDAEAQPDAETPSDVEDTEEAPPDEEEEEEVQPVDTIQYANDEPPTDDVPPFPFPKPHDGQGGPLEDLDIAAVSEALDMLEAKVSTRRESLDDFQLALKQQREQLAIGAAVASGYSPNFAAYSLPTPSGTVQFDFAGGLPIIPAAGT